MEDERASDCRGEGSECSGDSCKTAGSSGRPETQSGLAAVGEKLRRLHNGEPERVSSDEECVVEVSANKVGAQPEDDDTEKESVDSEEELKLQVDVDLSSDEQVAREREEEREVIELSAGEDDDCEVLVIKGKEEEKSVVSAPREKNSVEVVDIDDSGELDELQIDDTQDKAAPQPEEDAASVVEDKDVEEDPGAEPAAVEVEEKEESVEVEEKEESVEVEEKEESVEVEEKEESGAGEETEVKTVDEEKSEVAIEEPSKDAVETSLEDVGDKPDDAGGQDESAKTVDIGESVETEEQKSVQGDAVDAACVDVEECPAKEVEEPRTAQPGPGDNACMEGDSSVELPDSENFLGFEHSELHSFDKESHQVDGSEGELLGTLYVTADSHFFIVEGAEGPAHTSGSEAGEFSRLSPVPTESSRCNSPSVSSVSGERRSGRKRNSLDVKNPIYMKPFEFGWKRELVYRSSMDSSSSKRMADVYYYTPTNRKIRSAREVLDYVDGVELTIKNFLFTKEPMGLDCSKETIRDARKSFNLKDTPSRDIKEDEEVSPPMTKSPEKQKSPKVAETAPSPVEPKSPLGQAANSSPPAALRKAAAVATPTRSFPRIKVTPTRTQQQKVGKRTVPRPLLPKPRDQDLEMGLLPPLWSAKAATPLPKKATVSTTWSNTPKMVSEPLEKKMDPCSIHCPLKMGVIPTLQCRLCVCLYHPECVGLASFSETIHSYVCKNCQMEIKEGKTSLVPPVKVPLPPVPKQFPVSAGLPPLAPVPALPPPAAPRAPLPFRQVDPGKVVTDSGKLVTVPRFVKTRAVFAPQEAKQQPGKKILGSVTTWLPSSASVQMPKATAATSCEAVTSSPPASMQSVAWINNRKYIVVPKHNVLSVSPSPADKPPVPAPGAGGERAVQAKETGGMLLGSPPGVLLVPLLPPADKGSAMQTQYLIVNASPGGSLVLPAPTPLPGLSQPLPQPDTGKDRSRKRALSPGDEGPPSKMACMEEESSVERIPQMQNFVHDVCVMYNVLQHVFQYLKVQELLRAARVCRLWRDLAQHPSLWASVHMKNSKVSDWQGLTSTLSARRTSHLDLRKMLLPQRQEDVASMWEQFCEVIGRMDCLERLDLCRCPASVVQHVLTACTSLRTLNATAISCNSISLQDAGGLSNLEELRLKSLSGITLETSLSVLSRLSNLKHLALTTFRNLGQQGVEVVGSLESLELLELGEVNNLPQSFPTESLARLSNLRRLRLEKVQGIDTLTFNYLETARSLSQLTQLELVNFDVKPGFDTILASCSNIRKLLIIPTYVTQSATTNRMVLGGVLQLSATLQQFVWGVTHELLRVTELFVDQCDVDQVKKEQLKKGDCIPVLKPVPGIAAVNSPSDVWSCEEKYGGPTPSVEILSLPKLHKLLNLQLPQTKVKLLKIPFHATWRQYLSDMHA